jgi:rhomboid family GlyGly-CTERM serine protease
VKVEPISRPFEVAFRRLRNWSTVLAILVACLALAVGGDELRELGRYQRDALDAGEYWRLVSGHLVHLGLGHLWPNVAALLILAALFDDVFHNADWLRVSLASAAAIDIGLYLFSADVLWYVGLSGVLHGVVAAGTFALLLQRQAIGVVLALGLVAKLAFEQLAGPVPFTAASVGGPVVVAAHLYGAGGGLLAEVLTHAGRRLRSRV